jgi:PPOX class probable F420-dependent enzyme
MNIDTSTPFGTRVAERLLDDRLIWLTTVAADGMPQPSPVWFLWDGATILIYSQSDKPKLRHIQRSPKVALNFDGNGQGGDIVIITGEAEVDEGAPPADQIPEYVEKYAAGITRIGLNPQSFAQKYSVPIRIRPSRLRGF